MNKQDLILILIVLLCGGSFFIAIQFIKPTASSNAHVYYDNKLVQTIDLSYNGIKEYTVKGYNGDIVIETKHNQIRVKEEKSPLHICSKQGWVSSPLEPIVCLPNKIVIKIEAKTEKVDAVVR
jgi:hypothetical protein